jgi:predicted nuclease of predicted toxin-antitoxin system
MRLKLNENLSRHLKDRLSRLGHEVATAADEGLLSKQDAMLAAATNAGKQVLLTLDRGFANPTQYPRGSHPGIFLFRPDALGPSVVNDFVEEFMSLRNI